MTRLTVIVTDHAFTEDYSPGTRQCKEIVQPARPGWPGYLRWCGLPPEAHQRGHDDAYG